MSWGASIINFPFRHSVFANWRMSAWYLPIGEKLVHIRQLAKTTIGESEDWRKENTPICFNMCGCCHCCCKDSDIYWSLLCFLSKNFDGLYARVMKTDAAVIAMKKPMNPILAVYKSFGAAKMIGMCMCVWVGVFEMCLFVFLRICMCVCVRVCISMCVFYIIVRCV